MLKTTQLLDLVAGKLSNEAAYQYLLEICDLELNANLLNDLVEAILQTNERAFTKVFVGQNNTFDCCGTGGSGKARFNTSTAVAFVLAAGGLKVAKFGNKAVSGKSGSFDFLSALGFPLIVTPEISSEILSRTNLCFLFAPQFYPALTALAPIRKQIAKPTPFNIVGPLLNPLNPDCRIIGAPGAESQQVIAEYFLHYQSSKKVIVVRSQSGLDELDPLSANEMLFVNNSTISHSSLSPGKIDTLLDSHSLDAADNAQIFQAMMSKPQQNNNFYNSVTLNAGAAFLVANKAKSLAEGQILAQDLFCSGAVLDKFEQTRSAYAKYS